MTENLHENAFPYSDHARHKGMELRDYFAAKFAAVVLDGYQHSDGSWGESYENDIAKEAYKLADAMMVARKDKQNEKNLYKRSENSANRA